LAIAIRFAPNRQLAVALLVALLAFGVPEMRQVLGRVRVSQVLFAAGRDWVDRAPRGDGTVGLAPSPIVDGVEALEGREHWWDVEFWNRSIERVYSYAGSNTHTPFPRVALEVDRHSGRLRARPLPRFLVVAKRGPALGLRGREVGEYGRLKLVDLGARPQALWTVEGLTPRLGGARPGGRVVLSVYPRSSARRSQRWEVTLHLAAPRGLGSQSFRFGERMSGRRAGRVRPQEVVARTLSLCAGPDPARITISSGKAGAEVPLAVSPSAERVGLLISFVRAVPRPGSCRS